MHAKTIYVSFVIPLIIISFISCSQQKTEWKGTTEEVDGVMIVTNPAEPFYGKITFELEEDLSIGNEEDDNYLFYRAVDIAVDHDANIYVVEYRNCRIQKFDRDGKYIQTMGRQGQGPGEFEMPHGIYCDENTGNIYVVDGREIVIFDSNGDYLSGVTFMNFPSVIMIDIDGNMWMKFSKIGSEGVSDTISMANSQGELIKDIVEYSQQISMYSRGSSLFSITHGYEYQLLFSEFDSQTFVYGYSNEYKLNVVRNDGELLCILEKDEPQMPFTSNMKSKIIERYKSLSDNEKAGIKFQDSFPYFNSILTDNIRRIYVKRMHFPLEEEDSIECDIFNKDGYYLYKTKFPKQPEVIKNGYYYIIEMDEEIGLETVKRYKINNWEQIKTGIN